MCLLCEKCDKNFETAFGSQHGAGRHSMRQVKTKTKVTGKENRAWNDILMLTSYPVVLPGLVALSKNNAPMFFHHLALCVSTVAYHQSGEEAGTWAEFADKRLAEMLTAIQLYRYACAYGDAQFKRYQMPLLLYAAVVFTIYFTAAKIYGKRSTAYSVLHSAWHVGSMSGNTFFETIVPNIAPGCNNCDRRQIDACKSTRSRSQKVK